ncbi:DUF4352 domain-containing protein [Mycobacterium asiaticum]|uniref:DUF4352 domain-containing protein n=1 Tax=Mycobacterium asiaticum TaxID=1790 RepID=UPI00056D652C|nr:DUF4352 domain-containing protein [Mycobacterium asiaticum]ORA15901.1 hypothetical protein BST16_08460 [Mycobacterium asiaticum DSM 44297]
MRRFAWFAVAVLITGCLGTRHHSGPGLNDEVRDGTLAFTVTAIHLGVPKTGHRTAQGVFVVVNLMVKNGGPTSRAVYCQDQTLTDFSGKHYDHAVNLDGPNDRTNIEPGKEVHVTCAFDVPNGMLPASITLRASQFSHGVRVALLAAG